MNDYGKYMTYFEDINSTYKLDVSDDYFAIMRNLVNDYDNVSMDDWFEDEPIVEKKIPEFNFVK